MSQAAQTDDAARVLAMQASKVRRDATVSAEETGGFKYVPGGREYFCLATRAIGGECLPRWDDHALA